MQHIFIMLMGFAVMITLVFTSELMRQIIEDRCVYCDKKRICLTPGCIVAASDILSSINTSADPCNDFYKFACGNFLKKIVIPDDKLYVMKSNELNNRVSGQIKAMLEEPPISSKEQKPFLLPKKLYKVCMDTTAIEDDNLLTIKLLLDKLGGWPVLTKKWNEKQFDWKTTMYNLRTMGFPSNNFLKLDVAQDPLNSSSYILVLDELDLGLDREYLLQGFNSTFMQAFYNYVVDIAIIFGAERKYAAQELEMALKFQINLANITLPQEKRRNYTALTNFITIGELEKQFPKMSWLDYINHIISTPRLKIGPQEVVDIIVPKFLVCLDALLETTPKRVQANYIMTNLVGRASGLLTKKIRQRRFLFEKLFLGAQKMPPRWKECVNVVAHKLPVATGAMYVRKYFGENSIRNAQELVYNLRTTFINMLRQTEWMDKNTQTKAIEKAAAMTFHVGYPPEFSDNDEITDYYVELKSSNNYLHFILNINLFHTNIIFRKLRQVVNKTDWRKHSFITQVNAAYNIMENSILLPVGILQEPFFRSDRPNYLNYGGLGFVIGHEITHGFDDRGRQCDKDGTLIDWWEKETENAYIKKAQCIIDQYGNYTSPEINMTLNGIITQGENIADNGGIKEAYMAYSAWVERNGEEPRLPGLHYTPKQLFWISAANIWCSKERPEYLQSTMLVNNHPPAYFRITGSFRNSKYFSKDFNCPLGSNMNPEHKCQVW